MCISNQVALKFVLWLKYIYHKYSLNHVLLLASYSIFIIIAATIFFLIESLNYDDFQQKWQVQLASDRDKFIREELVPEIFNNTKLLLYIHDQKAQYLTNIMNLRLEMYEKQLKLKPPLPTMNCSYLHSVLFIFSTITTIGYGYIYPVTYGGRIFSIACSLIGIPFTIIVVKDLAYLLAKLLDFPCILLEKVWALFRFCTLKPVSEDEIERKLRHEPTNQQDYRIANQDRLLSIPVTVAVFAVIGWTCLGCVLTHIYLPNIETSVAFYFVFNSLTTTGVGDIEPGNNSVILLFFSIYVLFGLAIVSLFINLIHAKFSRAYWLPERMYFPLRTTIGGAETLATFDSYDELMALDHPLNHLITMGIIQAEDKCPLLNITSRETAIVESSTQTRETVACQIASPSEKSLGPIVLPAVHTSHEDINSLIVETYGARPALLIQSMVKK